MSELTACEVASVENETGTYNKKQLLEFIEVGKLVWREDVDAIVNEEIAKIRTKQVEPSELQIERYLKETPLTNVDLIKKLITFNIGPEHAKALRDEHVEWDAAKMWAWIRASQFA